ncbi:MAG: prolyl oligopeptidase [bacterium P3]|nr:MAG: prolyl oligopeptidase [bacterium P3]KWW40656.1 MAG: prolyl oligopeptidase [bacterium F083]
MKHLLLSFIKKSVCVAGVALLFTACTRHAGSDVIGKPEVVVQDGRFTPEIMWQLGVLSEYAVSPDGSRLLYTVRYTDMGQDKNNTDLYLMPVSGGDAQRLTVTAGSEFSPVWYDANTVMYCRGNQILAMDLQHKKERVVAECERGFEGFKVAPDGKSIAYITTIPVERPGHIGKLFNGLDKTTGRINEDLMYRHWDQWVDEIPRICLVPLSGGKADMSKAVDILGDEPYEAPMRPWGGTEQYNFSPDSKLLAYTCRKKTGYDYAHSTNSDIFLYDIADGTTRNISDGIMGYDQNPVFSHDGRMIAWESMERDGYESDKQRLMVLDLESGVMTDLTENFDFGVNNLCWSDDDSQLAAMVCYRGTNQIFAFDLKTKSVRQISQGHHDVNSFRMHGSDIYAQQVSIRYPAEIYRYTLTDNQAEGRKLTAVNDEVLSQVRMGKVEEHWIKTVDGKEMLTWLIYPYDYDSTKTYPALLFCEGGPQTMVSQFWSTRWNFEVMSGAGYFVIAPNRRGVPGFGMEWLEAISGDYGGRCMQDYMAATDWFADNFKQIDKERIGACGASFGGYSVYWLAGHNHDVSPYYSGNLLKKGYDGGRRFKAFLAHNGMFNFEQQYLETEEMWFDNWDLGGPYWDWNNPQIKKSYSNSPHLFVDKWNTPICVIHSEFDFRIVASEGMAAYNAAQMRHIPSRYLYFPDETHWVLKPQNSLLWHRNFIDWFDTWLK